MADAGVCGNMSTGIVVEKKAGTFHNEFKFFEIFQKGCDGSAGDAFLESAARQTNPDIGPADVRSHFRVKEKVPVEEGALFDHGTIRQKDACSCGRYLESPGRQHVRREGQGACGNAGTGG